LKRLGVVLQNASTGGWRYTCRLVEGLLCADPSLEVTVYLGPKLKSTGEAHKPFDVLTSIGAKVAKAPNLKSIDQHSKLRYMLTSSRYFLQTLQRKHWHKSLESNEIVLFTWPYGITCPSIRTPVVFIPHDFNYNHFFGNHVLTPRQCMDLRREHERWYQNAIPVVSSQFIANEATEFYPQRYANPEIIPPSQLGRAVSLSSQEVDLICQSHGATGNFIISLGNTSHHKNIGQLLSGFYLAKEKYPELKLILAGQGTQEISGTANSSWYIDSLSGPGTGDVQGLGLLPDHEITALIKRAKLVINASLYEAGNGSGLDAWALGTPVAMSAIPAFLEQLRFLGVHAETFHPRCCHEIGQAITRILDAPEKAQNLALLSKSNLERYTWKEVAHKYLALFRRILAVKSLTSNSGSQQPKAAA